MTRWQTDTAPGHSQRYVERFRTMAADGTDLAGEARLVDAMLPRGARVLDAGCGPGRVGAAIAERGHVVVGVDADPVLIDAAIADHPGPKWLVADLADFELRPEQAPFDAAVIAGNVMAFVAPGTETAVLARVAAHLVDGGFVIVGFGVERGYAVVDFDAHLQAAGLRLEHRFATWDLQLWTPDSPFAVSVLRRDAGR